VTALAVAVVVLQLLLPLALSAFAFSRRPPEPTRLPGNTEQTPSAASPELTPLLCPSCQAPVPLLGERFACPHCSAAVEPPPDYAKLFHDRAAAAERLAHSEELLFQTRLFTSKRFVGALRFGVVVWFFIVGAAWVVIEDAHSRWLAPLNSLAILLAFMQTPLAFWFTGLMKQQVAPLPTADRKEAAKEPAAVAPCQRCKAPTHFAAGHLAGICVYCGASNYRAALARLSSAESERDYDAAQERFEKALRTWASTRMVWSNVLFGITAFELLRLGLLVLALMALPFVQAL
jgi:hypothetical protein